MTESVHRLGEDPAGRAAALDAAAEALRSGGVALLPAEGLYGLHAAGLRPGAAGRLAALKGGPPRPFILLVGAPAHALALVDSLPGPAAALIEREWPGPLTLLLPASPLVPGDLCRDGLVALRCPGQPFLRELLLLLSEPLLSTSANRAGSPAPRSLAEVAGEILRGCDVAVDGGELSGEGSTVARPETSGALTILRRGLWRPV